MRCGCRIGQNQRALSKIVENKRGQGHEKPRQPDRRSAEMTQIRIESLCARDCEEYRAENDKSNHPVRQEKPRAMCR